jgi:hypothetical protein
MKLVLIATPRTGSTVIGEYLTGLARQWWGCKGWLNEYFAVNQNLITRAKIIQDRVVLEHQQYVDRPWCADPAQERLIRKQFLDNDPNYVLKFLPGQFDSWTVPWIKEQYTPIFLERRNKTKQLLSWLAAKQVGVWYWHDRANQPVTNIAYDEQLAVQLIWCLREYNSIKQQFADARTIYYEDWLAQGADQQALIDLLGFDNKEYVSMQTDSVNTPYEDDPEDMILNDSVWLAAKDRIVTALETAIKL